jgi:hypothetical protein
MVSFDFAIPFTPYTLTESGIEVDSPVGTVTVDYTGGIDLPYGQETTVAEVLSEAEPEDFIAPILDVTDDWYESAVSGAGALAQAHAQGQAEQVDLGDLVGSIWDTWSDPATSPITPYAEAYVDWYQTGTPVERALDQITDWGSGTGQEIEDIVTGGLETVPAIVEAGGTAGATILKPLAEPTGDFLESLILPATILGGAYILLK